MSSETTPLGKSVEGNDEIFEINDFTTVTESECFAAALETVIHDWGLGGGKTDGVKKKNSYSIPKDFLQTCKWRFQSEKISYGLKITFNLTHYYPENLPSTTQTDTDNQDEDELAHLHVPAKDLLTSESDFTAATVITSQFGVYEFLVLTPAMEHLVSVDSEDFLNTILSGISIASINSECTLPIFVQYGLTFRYLYAGISQNRNARINFDGCHLKMCQKKHNYLSGIIDMFKEKVNCPISDPPSINVSIQFDYVLEESIEMPSVMPSHYLDEDEPQNKLLSGFNLPIGSESDPISELRLTVAWPGLKEEILNETEFYSDLDPHGAPKWFVSVGFIPGVELLLHSTLKRLLEICDNQKSHTRVDYYAGKATNDSPDRAFRALTQGHYVQPTQLNFITNPTGVSPGASVNMPLNEEDLKHYMKFIFEKADKPGEDEFENLTADGGVDNFEEGYKKLVEKCKDILRISKAADKNSLTEKISIMLAKCFVADSSTKEIVELSQIWDEFVSKLREYWENNDYIPGLPEVAPPDFSKCKFHQKLQMIQCCIESRKRRHKLYDENKMFIGYEDDEFFDANEEFLSDDEDDRTKKAKIAASTSANREPIGRLHPLNDLTLLNFPDRPLYVPVTQDRSPMTEDMLEEHAEYLSTLGEGEERVRAQIGTLLSDMQAFKSANPGCCMEDFVRWHSPRDWIQEADGGDSQGRLSERMTTKKNIWVDTWNIAMARPVIHQDRLFNEVKEAEQILHSFAHIQVNDLVQLIWPVVFTTSVRKLVEEVAECYPLVEANLLKLCQKVSWCCMNQMANKDEYLDVLREIMIVEKVLAHYLALRSRFTANSTELNRNYLPLTAKSNELRDFVIDILRKPAITPIIGPKIPDSTEPVRVLDAPNGPLAMAVRYLFNQDARLIKEKSELRNSEIIKKTEVYDFELKFPPANRKHYVLRWLVPCKGPGSRPMPQRLYVLVGDVPREFRICEAFTSDTTFY